MSRLFWRRIHENNALFVFISMVSTVATFTLPAAVTERLRSDIVLPVEDHEMIGSEIQHEDDQHSTETFSEGDDDKSMDFLPEFLANILPSSLPFFSSQADSTESQVAPAPNDTSASSSISPSGLLHRLFPSLIIERPSLFRVQFYNSDYEDSKPPNEENSTMPNAIFGSPLCVGLCVPVQVFAEHSSIRVLSNRKISLLPLRTKPKPPNPDPTPLSPLVSPITPPSNTKVIINITRNFNQQSSPYGIAINAPENVPTNIIIKAQNEDELYQKYNLSATSTIPPPITSSSESEATTEESAFEWLPSWIITPPSLSQIQDSIQLPGFPNISVYDIIG